MNNHRLGCMTNIGCLVMHPDGVCPGLYGKCTCDLKIAPPENLSDNVRSGPPKPEEMGTTHSQQEMGRDWKDALRLTIAGTPRTFGTGITEETIIAQVEVILSQQKAQELERVRGIIEGRRQLQSNDSALNYNAALNDLLEALESNT